MWLVVCLSMWSRDGPGSRLPSPGEVLLSPLKKKKQQPSNCSDSPRNNDWLFTLPICVWGQQSNAEWPRIFRFPAEAVLIALPRWHRKERLWPDRRALAVIDCCVKKWKNSYESLVLSLFGILRGAGELFGSAFGTAQKTSLPERMGGWGEFSGNEKKKQKTKGRMACQRWMSDWDAAEFFDLAGPGMALAEEFVQPRGRREAGRERGREAGLGKKTEQIMCEERRADLPLLI